MKEKKVLFVVYEFPPEGCRGTKRGMKFIKYLIPLGWKPLVLTVKSPNYEFHDGSLLSELPPGLEIFRASTMESLFYRADYESGEVRDTGSEKRNRAHLSMIKRLMVSLYHQAGKFLRIPDSRVLWLPFALMKGLKIIRKENIDVIFASGPSFTNHLTGMLLKKLSGKPLVIDFRDAWVSDPARKLGLEWQRKLFVKLEKQAVMNADKVVSTTNGITADFIKRYGDGNNKFVTITNGFDPDDFSEIETKVDSENRSSFRIVHAGTLGWERSPKEFLQAVGELIKENPDFEKNIQVIFVGQNGPFRDGKTIEDYIDAYKLGNVVKLTGFVSRKESLKYISDAHLLLLIIGKVPKDESDIYGISAKIYDYALTGRPVMTISEEGASARMASHLRLGCVVDPDNTEAIKKWIKKYYDDFLRTGRIEVNANEAAIQDYDFRNLTSRLVECFKSIT